MTNSDTKYMQY